MNDKAALRRKLLRGSLAAPAVLTVSSASAAMTSFGRCLRASSDTSAQFFVPTADNLYRRRVQVTMLTFLGRNIGYFYLDPVKSVWISCDNFNIPLPFGSLMPNGWETGVTEYRWALVWFDKNTSSPYSQITVMQPLNSTSTTMSCYGSFKTA
jgi:hypothetical protein